MNMNLTSAVPLMGSRSAPAVREAPGGPTGAEHRLLDEISQMLQEAHVHVSNLDGGLAEVRNRLFGQVEAFEALPAPVPDFCGKVNDLRVVAENLRDRLQRLPAHLKHLNDL